MEKRTLTSALALIFLMAGTATFAMDDENKSQYVYSLPQNFKKGDQLEVLIEAKEGDVLPFIRININEKVSTGGIFIWGSKSEVKKHPIGSLFEKNETIISSRNLLQTKVDTLIVEDSSPLQVEVTEVVKPILLTFKKGTAREYSENDGMIAVTTDDNANATYQTSSNRLPVTPGEKFILNSNIALAKGKMSVGVLNTESNGWIVEEIFLKPGFYAGVKEFVIPEKETEISLVLRNYHLGTNGGAGQSKFTAKLELEKVEVISKSTISDDTSTSQTDNTPSIPLTPLSVSLVDSNKIEEPIKLLKTPKKKKGGFWSFSWLFSKEEEPVTQEEVNEFPSDRAYLNAALKMKETNANDFDILMKYAKAMTEKEIPEGAKEAVSMLMELSKGFKDIKDVVSEENTLTEDTILLKSFLKQLRSEYVLRLQKNVYYQPTQSFIISIPKHITEEN